MFFFLFCFPVICSKIDYLPTHLPFSAQQGLLEPQAQAAPEPRAEAVHAQQHARHVRPAARLPAAGVELRLARRGAGAGAAGGGPAERGGARTGGEGRGLRHDLGRGSRGGAEGGAAAAAAAAGSQPPAGRRTGVAA